MDEFSTPYVQKVREAVEDENFIFMYHNCGNISPLLDRIRALDMQAYSIGNAVDVEKVPKSDSGRPYSDRQHHLSCRNDSQWHAGKNQERDAGAFKSMRHPNFMHLQRMRYSSGCTS